MLDKVWSRAGQGVVTRWVRCGHTLSKVLFMPHSSQWLLILEVEQEARATSPDYEIVQDRLE